MAERLACRCATTGTPWRCLWTLDPGRGLTGDELTTLHDASAVLARHLDRPSTAAITGTITPHPMDDAVEAGHRRLRHHVQ